MSRLRERIRGGVELERRRITRHEAHMQSVNTVPVPAVNEDASGDGARCKDRVTPTTALHVKVSGPSSSAP